MWTPSFSAVVDAAARGEPQMVTRRGKWVSVVLSAEEYERLQRLGAGDGDVHMGCDGEGVCGG